MKSRDGEPAERSTAEPDKRCPSDGSLAEPPIFPSVAHWVRANWLRLTAISVAVLAPCFWHRHIAAGDLGSHLYNAWLVELIHEGKAPGLWIADQSNNVLFDFILSALSRILGFPATEKVAVSLAVLIFFWGAFALACAATRRTPWFLLPALAMITYGWTFHSGFFNYYLGIGLSFWSLAIFWRATGWGKLFAVPFAPLTFLAHPLALAWLIGAVAYLALAARLPQRYHSFILLLAAGLLVGVHFYVWHNFKIGKEPYPAAHISAGADQLVLGTRYYFPAAATLLLGFASLILDARQRRTERTFWVRHGIPLQLYALTLFGVWLLPTLIHLPQYAAPLVFVQERLSLISATLACCVVGAIEPRRWVGFGFAGIAVVFFAFVYQDTAVLNRMEAQVEDLLRTVPAGERIMETIDTSDGGRSRLWFNSHMVDRACIGRCFSFGNYEPSTGQFRVRARPGNGIVVAAAADFWTIQQGNYVVRPEDLPVHQIYQPGHDWTELRIRALIVGEKNDRLGFGRK